MLELADYLRQKQAAQVAGGKPPYPVSESFTSSDPTATYTYDIGRFEQSSLRGGPSGNILTINMTLKVEFYSQVLNFDLGTFSIEGCDMLCMSKEEHVPP